MNLITYGDICYESSTLKMEIEGLTDDALIDECGHILVGLESEEMDNILLAFFKNGKLSGAERAKAEDLYLLAYLDLGWEE